MSLDANMCESLRFALFSRRSHHPDQPLDALLRVQDADETRLRSIRLRTSKREIIVAPGHGCTLVVLQRSASFVDAKDADGDEDED